jgi:hypothetical protein
MSGTKTRMQGRRDMRSKDFCEQLGHQQVLPNLPSLPRWSNEGRAKLAATTQVASSASHDTGPIGALPPPLTSILSSLSGGTQSAGLHGMPERIVAATLSQPSDQQQRSKSQPSILQHGTNIYPEKLQQLFAASLNRDSKPAYRQLDSGKAMGCRQTTSNPPDVADFLGLLQEQQDRLQHQHQQGAPASPHCDGPLIDVAKLLEMILVSSKDHAEQKQAAKTSSLSVLDQLVNQLQHAREQQQRQGLPLQDVSELLQKLRSVLHREDHPPPSKIQRKVEQEQQPCHVDHTNLILQMLQHSSASLSAQQREVAALSPQHQADLALQLLYQTLSNSGKQQSQRHSQDLQQANAPAGAPNIVQVLLERLGAGSDRSQQKLGIQQTLPQAQTNSQVDPSSLLRMIHRATTSDASTSLPQQQQPTEQDILNLLLQQYQRQP